MANNAGPAAPGDETGAPSAARIAACGPPRPARGGLLARFRRFRRADEGATAIEFAAVAMPFFGLSFAILETALFFFSAQVLETATADAARFIFTGQASMKNIQSQADMKREICSRVPALFDCCAAVSVDVRNYGANAGAATVGVPIRTIGGNRVFDPSDFRFEPSGSGQIVVIRAAMEYPVHLSFLAGFETNLSNGKRLVLASAAFRNEPFTTPTGSPPPPPPAGCRNG